MELHIRAGDSRFWQGTFRDSASEELAAARATVESPLTRGGGHTASVSLHWHVDGRTPR